MDTTILLCVFIRLSITPGTPARVTLQTPPSTTTTTTATTTTNNNTVTIFLNSNVSSTITQLKSLNLNAGDVLLFTSLKPHQMHRGGGERTGQFLTYDWKGEERRPFVTRVLSAFEIHSFVSNGSNSTSANNSVNGREGEMRMQIKRTVNAHKDRYSILEIDGDEDGMFSDIVNVVDYVVANHHNLLLQSSRPTSQQQQIQPHHKNANDVTFKINEVLNLTTTYVESITIVCKVTAFTTVTVKKSLQTTTNVNVYLKKRKTPTNASANVMNGNEAVQAVLSDGPFLSRNSIILKPITPSVYKVLLDAFTAGSVVRISGLICSAEGDEGDGVCCGCGSATSVSVVSDDVKEVFDGCYNSTSANHEHYNCNSQQINYGIPTSTSGNANFGNAKVYIEESCITSIFSNELNAGATVTDALDYINTASTSSPFKNLKNVLISNSEWRDNLIVTLNNGRRGVYTVARLSRCDLEALMEGLPAIEYCSSRDDDENGMSCVIRQLVLGMLSEGIVFRFRIEKIGGDGGYGQEEWNEIRGFEKTEDI